MNTMFRLIGRLALAAGGVSLLGGDLKTAQSDAGAPPSHPQPLTIANTVGTVRPKPVPAAQSPVPAQGKAKPVLPPPPVTLGTLVEPARDGFAPVPLERLRQPLPENEVWLIQTVLLNPDQGTLADPGRWAAPARKLTDQRHWK